MLRACLIALGLGWPALALSAAADPPPAAAEAPAATAPAATDPAATPAAEPAAPAQPAPDPSTDPNAPPPTPAPAPVPAEQPAAAPAPADAAPAAEAAPPAEAKPEQAPAPDAVAATPEEGVKEKVEEPGTMVQFLGYKLPVTLRAALQYRQLTVSDQTPSNDRYGSFDFALSFKPTKQVSAFLTLGVLQKGWAEEGETGAFFKDMAVGAAYAHPVALDALGVGLYQKQQAKLSANLRLWLPTSRASSRQEMYTAPELRLAASAPVLPDWVEVGLELRSTYRFIKYAERSGVDGALNTRFTLQAIPFLEVEFLKLGRFGTVNLEADVWWLWALSYPSRDHHSTTASGADYWQQQFGWDLGLAYHPKPWAKVGFSFEQGGNLLRDGIVNMFYDLRDENEFAVTVELLF